MEMYKNLIAHATEISIITGSIIGSLKANLDDVHVSSKMKIVNIILGLFCGLMVAGEYSVGISFWLSGILAMVSAMVGGTVLDVIKELTPSITKLIIKFKLGIKKDE